MSDDQWRFSHLGPNVIVHCSMVTGERIRYCRQYFFVKALTGGKVNDKVGGVCEAPEIDWRVQYESFNSYLICKDLSLATICSPDIHADKVFTFVKDFKTIPCKFSLRFLRSLNVLKYGIRYSLLIKVIHLLASAWTKAKKRQLVKWGS